jgi:hypothetical protein
VQDHLRGGYALITCAPYAPGLEKLGGAFRSLRCPFQVLDVSEVHHAREFYVREHAAPSGPSRRLAGKQYASGSGGTRNGS